MPRVHAASGKRGVPRLTPMTAAKAARFCDHPECPQLPQAGRGIGDGLQLAQGVRTAKLVISGGIGGIWGPGVMNGDPANEGSTPTVSIASVPRF